MRRKIIPIPPKDEVDVTEVKPILFHRHMARLDRVAQLGGVQPGFPGAKHSRLEHAIGTFSKTRRRAERWAEMRQIDRKDVLPLSVAGLVHDIGHPALSHVLERRLELDHHANGLALLREMREEFDEVGCGWKRVKSFLDKRDGDPLGRAVTDRVFGTDKLDYLWRDAYHAGVDVAIDFPWVESRLFVTERGLAIDMMAVAGLRALLMGYLAMYGEFYLRKSSRIAQEFLGRTFAFMLAEGAIDRAAPLRMTDDEFFSAMWRADSEEVREMRERWKAMDLPKTALVLRREAGKERVAGKEFAVRECGEEELERYAGMGPDATDALADAIADAVGVPKHLVLVVKPTAAKKLAPDDVLLWDDGRVKGFAAEDPDFFVSLKRQASDYLALRVCVPREHRKRVAKAADAIAKIIADPLAG